jgi:hypothetical protein
MMTTAEISWLLIQLLSDTVYYRGDSFAYLACLNSAARLRHVKALLVAMPDGERVAVEASFGRIHAAVTQHRVAALMATHPTPAVVQ